MENAQTFKVQAGLFFKENFLDNFEKTLKQFDSHIPGYKGRVFFPLPPEIYNIPGLVLNYEDDLTINFSRGRLDVYCKNFEQLEPLLPKVFNVLDDLRIKIVRIGYVKNFHLPDKGDSYIKDFLNETLRSRELQDIAIRINERTEISGKDFNNTQTMQVAEALDGIKKTSGVLIIRDINSRIEDQNNFGNATIFGDIEKVANAFLF